MQVKIVHIAGWIFSDELCIMYDEKYKHLLRR